jgi:hypothetical protein
MDLIHANAEKTEIGFIDDFIKFDAEITRTADIKDNQFVLTLDENVWGDSPILKGHFVYIPFTEWGGPVEHIKHSTKSAQITLTGPTWRGMLTRKIIEPPAGEAYRTISNMEASAALRLVIGDMFGDYFRISDMNTEIAVSGSWRYTNLLSGIMDMFARSGLALSCAYDNTICKAILQARKITDYSRYVDLSQDYGIHLTSQQGGLEAFNHIIALGRGELTDREVIHLYRLDDGTITQTPPGNRGEKDLCTTYDYSSAESTEELIKGAAKRLEECVPVGSVEMDTSATDKPLELGDRVSARDRLTGFVTTATVQRKILVKTANGETIETKVG